MPYKTGSWGVQAQERSKRRKSYFQQKKEEYFKRLGLKYHEGVGYVGEGEALQVLKVKDRSSDRSFDILWNNKKVDVKTAIINKSRWQFDLHRQKGKIDYFLILCKNKKKETQYMFLIPDEDLKVKGLVISENRIMKYKDYLIEGVILNGRPEN